MTLLQFFRHLDPFLPYQAQHMPRELRQGLPLLIRPVARKRVCRRLLLPSAASPSTMGGLALWGRGALALSGASNGRSHPCSESQIICQSPDLLFVFGRLCCWAVLTMRPRPCTHRVPSTTGNEGLSGRLRLSSLCVASTQLGSRRPARSLYASSPHAPQRPASSHLS